VSLETQPARSKSDVREAKSGRDSVDSAGALSNSVWDSMKLQSSAKLSQPAAVALMFDSPFPDLKTAAVNARSEFATPRLGEQSGTKPEATKSHKNPDGGHTDTTTSATGSTEVKTYDQGGKLNFDRTDKRDGTFSEWKLDAKGNVSIHEKKSDGSLRSRDEYANGNFKEEIKYKDGKKSSSSHFADPAGGYTDDTVNKDGSEKLSHFDDGGKLVFKYSKNSDGSYSERKLNPDNSVVFHDQKADGSYTESKTDKSGTSRTIHTVNKGEGSSETKSYDPSGHLTSERKTKRDQSFTETTYNPDGTKTIHEQAKNGNYAEEYLNSKGERVSPTIAVVKASPEFVQKVKDEIAKLPESIRKMLTQNNAVIAIAGEMSDVIPSEAKEQPRGYEKGETGDDSSGVENHIVGKNGKKQEFAVIAEKTRSGPSDDVEGTVRHEVGHIIDSLLKDYSHSPAFKAAYDQDVAAMSKDTKEDEKYFLQKGHKGKDGQEETFAEVVRAITGDPSESRDAEVLKRFPKSAALLKKRLDQIPQ
jgi:hypothetical protein